MPSSSEIHEIKASDILASAHKLAEQLDLTAIERDQAGGHAAAERQMIRESGLLDLIIPEAFGGRGVSWNLLYAVIRILAEVDSALAHVFAFHHLQIATILLYGNTEQQQRLLTQTIKYQWFWGNSLNPSDRRTEVEHLSKAEGAVIHGVKSYSSGSVGSDWLTFSAWDQNLQALLYGVTSSHRNEIHIQPDWDSFGQKQTDSGNVLFNHVPIPTEDILIWPGTVLSPRQTLRTQLAQLVLVNLYVGISQGAFKKGTAYTREFSRPYLFSDLEKVVDDPFILNRYGQLLAQVRGAEVMAIEAVKKVDLALSQESPVTPEERGEVAIAVSQAKVLAHQAAIAVTNQLFELTGAGSTRSQLGLDRFWRNARVHTLHDPIDYKLRDLGRFALLGVYPSPNSYS